MYLAEHCHLQGEPLDLKKGTLLSDDVRYWTAQRGIRRMDPDPEPKIVIARVFQVPYAQQPRLVAGKKQRFRDWTRGSAASTTVTSANSDAF
jgi:hypothetical protein